ncbi:YqaE/Pmp3 family membrane protein [candidate division KSB1 bacterium]|nr:YqaE/Pmp3 family membrane protein [candidate division KSB1 bacterium]
MAAKKNKVLLFILSILLPPLAVYLVKGVKKDFWINIILCIFFWVPGIIHALYIVF